MNIQLSALSFELPAGRTAPLHPASSIQAMRPTFFLLLAISHDLPVLCRPFKAIAVGFKKRGWLFKRANAKVTGEITARRVKGERDGKSTGNYWLTAQSRKL
jgi:hypothetical protein